MKRYFQIVVLLALAACATAQPRLRKPEMYVGFQGGVMASTTMFTPVVENMTPITNACILGGTGGFVFRYSEQKCCAVQVELNYLQRGWHEKAKATDKTAAVDYARRLHYLEIPFLMHLYFGSKTWRGFLNVGPQIGFCLSDNGGSGDQSTTSIHQYASIDNRFDWGVTGGLGFYCRTQKAGLYQFEVRYNYSFGTLFGNKTTDYFSRSNPMELSINLAWLWELHPKPKIQKKPL